jgi:hypothetical protein
MLIRGRKIMKRIKLRPVTDGKPGQSTKEILLLVMNNSPNRAITVEEMRHRVAIMNAIDDAKEDESFVLEDADWQVLRDGINNFPWSVANKGLLTIIDDVLKPEEIPVSALQIVKPDKDKPKEGKRQADA